MNKSHYILAKPPFQKGVWSDCPKPPFEPHLLENKKRSKPLFKSNTFRSPIYWKQRHKRGVGCPYVHLNNGDKFAQWNKRSPLVLYIIKAVFAVVIWNSGAKRQPSAKRER